jgi:hypothetical protein
LEFVVVSWWSRQWQDARWLTAEIKKLLNPTPHGGKVVRLSST